MDVPMTVIQKIPIAVANRGGRVKCAELEAEGTNEENKVTKKNPAAEDTTLKKTPSILKKDLIFKNRQVCGTPPSST